MFDLDDFFTNETKLMEVSDLAEVECNDCQGCTNCCRELSAAITLDSFDVALLKKGLGKSFDELLEDGSIELRKVEGVYLPIFGNKADKNECVFLGENGRCQIHPYRAGICRMYPVARLWHEDGSFSYYLQKGECPNRSGGMIKISDWLGYDDIPAYEAEITRYHAKLKEYRKCCRGLSEEELITKREEFFDENFR